MRPLIAILLGGLVLSICLNAEERLVKFIELDSGAVEEFEKRLGGSLSEVSRAGNLFLWRGGKSVPSTTPRGVEFIQPNYRITLPPNPSLERHSKEVKANSPLLSSGPRFSDNPDLVRPSFQSSGPDPLLSSTWGIHLIGALSFWQNTEQGKDVVVAITDTGVDYTHPDLVNAIWWNALEKDDGVDNDGNGFVDDLVGWDFVSNDNRPYDLSLSLEEILLGQGNPGHGTHCAGVASARLANAMGAAGVAPRALLLPLRFINERGMGDSAGGVRAIDYAVQLAQTRQTRVVISASWGAEGDNDLALSDAIERARKADVLFVAAAGNGRLNPATLQMVGFDNDRDAKPVYPATFSHENIVAVAASTPMDELASFSNYGRRTVDLAAPGVKILSTVPGNRYQDTIVDLGQVKITWDGTSMATPFVAGSLAVVWSQDPGQSAERVKAKLLDHVQDSSSLKGRVLSEGRLELRRLH